MSVAARPNCWPPCVMPGYAQRENAMKPETALKLQDRLKREIQGLRQMVDQLADPEAGATPGGLKSGMVILARALLRTNQIMLDVTAAEVEAPSPIFPFTTLYGK